MNQKFVVKVKYQKIDADGKERIVTEAYLVEGVNFADAEEGIHTQLEPYISGEFNVESISKARFSDIIFGKGDRFFKATISLLAYNEESGAVKRSKTNLLVQAETLEEVKPLIEQRWNGTISDYLVTSVVETAIIEAFLIPSPTEKEE